MALDSIEDAIKAIANGELVVVVDDEDRENEGDLIMAASKATSEQLAFMIRHTSGIICAPMDQARADALNLNPMVSNNSDPMRTNFTVSVDYKVDLTTGISALERANTLHALANNNCVGADFARPGHVFPLISKPGGVLSRSGHTEAGTDLARLAGLEAVGVLSEIVNDDGTVKRLPELLEFSKEHDLRIISIEDLIEYRIKTESFVNRVNELKLDDDKSPTIYYYETPFDDMQHMALVYGDVANNETVPCRIHLEKPLMDIFDVQSGKNTWLENAIEHFKERGQGVLIFLRSPKLVGHAKLVDGAHASVEEAHQSAQKRKDRWRDIGLGAQILRDLNISKIALLASQEMDYVGVSGFGIEIVDTEIVER
jgi:3,4-dihydroxy 2-butanone 4-phosphate synthase/GTP cyclohydrolase II